ncbi:MAG: STAS domain-containing protein [Actinomycetota bacterium]
MTAHFTVSAERTDEMVTISCSGELDIATAPDVEHAIGTAVAPDAPRLIRLDWSGLTFMDSTGIRLLLSTVRRCKEAGSDLVWDLSPAAQRALDAVGIHDEILRSYGDANGGA